MWVRRVTNSHMAGLNHDFLLLSRQEYSSHHLSQWINSPRAVQIHDDVMRYIQDTLNWITCYNPGRRMTKQRGLNFCGPTIIKSDGAPRAEKVFMAWASMFSNGPKTLQLTGAYEWAHEDRIETRHYSTVIVDRDETAAKFTDLADYAKKVTVSKGQLLILHLGI